MSSESVLGKREIDQVNIRDEQNEESKKQKFRVFLLEDLKKHIKFKYPIDYENILNCIERESDKYNNIKDRERNEIYFFILILSELYKNLSLAGNELNNNLLDILKFMKDYPIILSVYSFELLMNTIKIINFWNIQPIHTILINNIIYEYVISQRKSFINNYQQIKDMDPNCPYRQLFLYSLGKFHDVDDIKEKDHILPSLEEVTKYCISDIFLYEFAIYLYGKKIVESSTEHFEIASKNRISKMISYYIKNKVRPNAKIVYYLKLYELDDPRIPFKINLFDNQTIRRFGDEISVLFTTSCHIDILKEFVKREIRLCDEVLFEASRIGNIPIMEFFFKSYFDFNSYLLTYTTLIGYLLFASLKLVIKHKMYDAFNYFYEGNHITSDIMDSIIIDLLKDNYYDGIKYLHENYGKYFNNIKKFYTYIIFSIKLNKEDYTYFLLDIYFKRKHDKKNNNNHISQIINEFILNGNIQFLDNFIIKYNIDLCKFENLTSLSVKYNNFDMLCYLTDKDASKDPDVVILAIEKCRLDMVKYAIEHDYPYPSFLKENINEKLELYKYLFINL